MSFVRLIVMPVAAVIAALFPILSSAQEDGPPTFYRLLADQNSIQLLDLASISGSGARTSAVTVDLFRGQRKFELRST